jgi:hypothetical protein
MNVVINQKGDDEMNKKNTKKLYDKFPKLYSGHTAKLTESLMPFGFCCGDGWYDIIYELSEEITKLDPDVRAVQIKEKFSGLRYYINSTKNHKVYDAIDAAEKKSYTVCEVCGKKGKLRKDLGWILTLCEDDYKKAKKR